MAADFHNNSNKYFEQWDMIVMFGSEQMCLLCFAWVATILFNHV